MQTLAVKGLTGTTSTAWLPSWCQIVPKHITCFWRLPCYLCRGTKFPNLNFTKFGLLTTI